MSTYLFTIDGTSFYAYQEPNWQPYGVVEAFGILGRPLTSGQGSFTATLRAVPYNSTYLSGAGDPLQSSGTFQQIFTLWRTAIATTGGRQTFTILDPHANTYATVKGILNIAKLLANLPGGAANPDVTIEVNAAFIDDTTWGTYSGGDTVPTTPPPYIPGDPLPPPDPAKTYGYGVGGYNRGYYGRGEGV
jgi:hypothetical protein